MHTSVQLGAPVEFIHVVPMNPFISKCQIKVCYVGEEANRNRSIITKEVAKDLANSLPGSPIVGYFDQESQDFAEHSRGIEIKDGQINISDLTRPYGFVDLNAKVWFAKYLDDGKNEREYLMTEGYLWTSQYPEAQQIIDQGKGQSMELDEGTMKAHWSKGQDGRNQFFIINEAFITKLCILGDDYEPCFEGANVTTPSVQFSLDDGFKNQMFKMMAELADLLDKGGTEMEDNKTIVVEDNETKVVEPATEGETPVVEEPVVTEPETETQVEDENENGEKNEDKVEQETPDKIDNTTEGSEENPAPTYDLEDIPEYVQLKADYEGLQTQNDNLVQEKDTLTNQIADLTATNENLTSQLNELSTFKAEVDRAKKQEMIDSFYMLGEEDKKEFVDNIDKYTVDEIEAQLSIICVRKKVTFSAEENPEEKDPTTYSINNAMDDPTTPAWVLRALEVEKNL